MDLLKSKLHENSNPQNEDCRGLYSKKEVTANKKKPKKLMERYDFLFLAGFGCAFLVTLAIFSILGLTPKEISTAPGGGLTNNFSLESQSNSSLFGIDFTKESDKIQKVGNISSDDLPVRIVISKVGVDTKIMNPESTSLTFLDNELSKAPVRYPGSGTIASGNIFIFGHSTGLKVVQNQAYKVFNNIKNLSEGDEIIVYSKSGKTFTYSIISTKEVSKDETYINFSSDVPSLTLSTCDRISQASDRFVVHAILRL